jgi:hypothetical protein
MEYEPRRNHGPYGTKLLVLTLYTMTAVNFSPSFGIA